MRTYAFALGLDFRVVVPERFILEQLQAARADDATPFQKQLIERFDEAVAGFPSEPSDDREQSLRSCEDAFCMALLKNGVRLGVRGHVLSMLESSGLGGSVSPVGIAPIEIKLKDEESAVNS